MRKLYPLVLTFLLLSSNTLMAQFTVNGVAAAIAPGPNEFQLTNPVNYSSGSVWNNTLIDLRQNFEICSQLYFGADDAGADGMAFVLQPVGLNALGNVGAGLGYHTITPSFVVEFDTWQNASPGFDLGDPAEDHLGFMSMGNAYHNAPSALSAPYPLPNIEDGVYHDVKFSWNAATKTFTVKIFSTTYTYTGDIVNNIFGGNPLVYWGCTASTGSTIGNIHKCKFFTCQPNCALTVNVADVYAVKPGGEPNTIYLGYGPSSLTLTASATNGTAPYGYKWSTGETTQSIVVSPSAPGDYTYTVTVTDANGCSGTKTVKVHVKDCTCGGLNGNQHKDHKVVVCHIPPGNPSNAHVICVDYHAVPAHLAHGDHLGACDGTEGDPRREAGLITRTSTKDGLQLNGLRLQPNPARGEFEIQLDGGDAATQIVITNANGVVIEKRTVKGSFGQSYKFDLRRQPAGIYLVQVIGNGKIQTQKVLIQK